MNAKKKTIDSDKAVEMVTAIKAEIERLDLDPSDRNSLRCQCGLFGETRDPDVLVAMKRVLRKGNERAHGLADQLDGGGNAPPPPVASDDPGAKPTDDTTPPPAAPKRKTVSSPASKICDEPSPDTKRSPVPIKTLKEAAGELRFREEDCTDTINEYTEEYAKTASAKAGMPPPTVFSDGAKYWLADGRHRILAAEKAGLTELECEIRQGGRREAIRHGVSANATHGLRRTNKDKRLCARIMLEEFPDLSDRAIAEMCAVSNVFVGSVRRQVLTINTSTKGSGDERKTRVGRDGKNYPVEDATRTPSESPAPTHADESTPEPPPVTGDAAGKADYAAVGKCLEKALEHAAGDNELLKILHGLLAYVRKQDASGTAERSSRAVKVA